VREGENVAVRALKRVYAPLLSRAVASPFPVIAGAIVLFVGALVLFNRLGQEFIPALDEKNIAMHALRIPSTALTQSQAMQFAVEKAVSRFPQVAFVYSKTGTAEIASDPMPPNVSDTFIILKPQADWPDPHLPKDALVAAIERAVHALPGNAYEFTQPIRMRFNELLAGVRGDIAVKIFGDEFDPLLRAANQAAGILRGVAGAADVRVEQIAGLPVLEIAPDKAQIARRGLSLSTVQEVIGAAVGGREAGAVYEGDRHFDIVVRLGEAGRNDIDALEGCPFRFRPTPPDSRPAASR
jgi:cobalt-zinc-cadmium resistance protein CzcA